MKTCQVWLQAGSSLDEALATLRLDRVDLLLVFCALPVVEQWPDLGQTLGRRFPHAVVAGCSTAGEIHDGGAAQGSAVITAVQFDHSKVRGAVSSLSGLADSRACGQRLGDALAQTDLQGVLVFGQGVSINGSALAEGLQSALGAGIPVTGGLAGDEGRFERTWVLHAGGFSDDVVVAVGLYGEQLQLQHAARGGWSSMGPLHRITRCEDNVLYELDDVPALDIYKRYLGELAGQLPGSGLLFPFELLDHHSSTTGLVRTPLGVDEAGRSITLAGALIPGGYLRLMNASMSALIDGAELAAQRANIDREPPDGGHRERLGLLVSCVGRRLVLGDMVGVEVDVVKAQLGPNTLLTGFHAYGELCPPHPGGPCTLHNQTMTVTVIVEG